MDGQTSALNQEEALDLLAYLLSSAQGCIQEPPDYAIYRLVTAAERLAQAWARRASGTMADYLQNLALQTPTQATRLDTDLGGFQEFLSEQIRRLALETKQWDGPGGIKNEP
jgi:hypothetical protein